MEIKSSSKLDMAFSSTKAFCKCLNLSDMFWILSAFLIVVGGFWSRIHKVERHPASIKRELLIYDYVEPGSTLPIHDALKEYRD